MTLQDFRFRRLRPNRDRVSASEYNRVITLVEKMARSMHANGIMDSTGFHTRRSPTPSSTQTYRAQVQEDSPADNKISVKLLDQDNSEIGDAFDVTCDIAGGNALNATIPRLNESDNDVISIYKQYDTWYCTMTFQTSENCDCS